MLDVGCWMLGVGCWERAGVRGNRADAISTTSGGLRLRRSPARQLAIGKAAFTLVEILVTVALLAFIILGLFAMFNQVQRAFRSSMNQVDQLEAGRAVTGLLPAEFEQTTPCGANAVTFSAQVIGTFPLPLCPVPLTQSLPGTLVQRTESAGGLLHLAASEPDLGRDWILCSNQ